MRKPSPFRHGWFRVPGIQPEGDRDIAEQLTGLESALAECTGKSILDLGSAEGCVSLEFAKAGAARVLGIERETEHLMVARRLPYDGPCVLKFKQWNIKKADPAEPLDYDIVLALAVIHKLEFPEIGLRWAARSAKSLLLLRSGRGSVNGIISGKYSKNTCNSAAVLHEEGFALEQTVDGPPGRDEPVEYFRRVKC